MAAAAETTTVVENELYRITFSNRGGEVTSPGFSRSTKTRPASRWTWSTRRPRLNLGYPLSLWTYDTALRNQLEQALFVPSATGTLNAPATLTLYLLQNGLEVKKVFTFDSTYVMHADVTATNHGSPVPALLAWPCGFGDQQTLPDYAQSQFEPCRAARTRTRRQRRLPGAARSLDPSIGRA